MISSAQYHIGMAIEGAGIPAATTISNIVGTTVTMSAAATLTQASSVRFFAWGAGDGSTTFNTPNLADYVTAGTGGTLFGAANNAVGLKGGAATQTLVTGNVPPHSHTISTPSGTNVTGAQNVVALAQTNAVSYTGFTVGGPSSPSAFSIVQQTALVRKFIRYE